MAKKFRTALIIEGDAKGGVRAVKATERELKKLGHQQKRTIATSKRMNKQFSNMKIAAIGAAGGLAGMVATRAIHGLSSYVTGVVSSTAALGDMSDALDINSDSLQEMLYAMRELDGNATIDDAANAIGKLSKRVDSALSGTKSYVRAFNEVGISVEDLRDKNPIEIFKMFADGFATATDKNKRLAAAMRIFGNNMGRRLLPLLSQGADGFNELASVAHETGAVLSSDMVKTAQEVDVEFHRLTTTISQTFKRGVLATIGTVKDFGEELGNVFDPDLITRLERINSKLEFMREQLDYSPFKSELGDEIALWEERAEAIKQNIRMAGLDARADAQLKKLRDRRARGAIGTDEGDAGAGKGSGKTAAEKLADKYDDLIAKQSKQIALFDKTSAVAEMRYRTEFGGLAKLSDARKKALIQNAKELQGLKDQKAAAESLFPALTRLRDLKSQADYIDTLGGGLGNLARKQMASQLGSIAGEGAPAMAGLDAVVGGPFGEMTRLEKQHEQYKQWYQSRLEMLQEFTKERYGVASEANAAMDQLNREHAQRTQAYERQSMSARLAGVQSVLGDITDITAQFSDRQGALYKAMFVANKTASIAQAIVNTETAATKALTLGPILGIPASTLIRATGYASIGVMAGTSMAQLAGQAHDGIDNVPNSGTWNLQKGERVIDRRTNVDLKQYLDRQNGGKRGSVNVTFAPRMSVNAQPGMSDADAARQGQQIGAALRSEFQRLVVDEQRPGGLLAGTA